MVRLADVRTQSSCEDAGAPYEKECHGARCRQKGRHAFSFHRDPERRILDDAGLTHRVQAPGALRKD